MRKGRILGFRGHHMSGIASLRVSEVIHTLTREVEIEVEVLCENAPTVRALEAAFGSVIGEGHTVRPDGGHVGKEVYYNVDAMGMLDGFSPVEDAPDAVVAAYEKTKMEGL
jgi:hypothetical protein